MSHLDSEDDRHGFRFGDMANPDRARRHLEEFQEHIHNKELQLVNLDIHSHDRRKLEAEISSLKHRLEDCKEKLRRIQRTLENEPWYLKLGIKKQHDIMGLVAIALASVWYVGSSILARNDTVAAIAMKLVEQNARPPMSSTMYMLSGVLDTARSCVETWVIREAVGAMLGSTAGWAVSRFKSWYSS